MLRIIAIFVFCIFHVYAVNSMPILCFTVEYSCRLFSLCAMEVRLSANNCLAEMGIPQVPWASRIPIEMPILMKWELFAWESTDRTHTFNGPLSGTTQVSQYQKGKINQSGFY